MKSLALTTAAAMIAATGAFADAQRYTLDASHSQIIFSYNHIGFSTTYGMFSGFNGEIMFDADEPAASSVSVSMPVMSMFTGWEQRDNHFMSGDFFGASEADMVTFTSTGIRVTGENTAIITGDLLMNGITKSVDLDARLNKADTHPMAGKPWLGFDATTTLKRSDFGLGAFAPAVGDEVNVIISLEAQKAD
ncbi:MAG: polyisoprenoid-binding protein [Rhodobacteraceae bacterium]|nr:polyisoprenoid-binding protein [Paracoccaceae bacterium]